MLENIFCLVIIYNLGDLENVCWDLYFKKRCMACSALNFRSRKYDTSLKKIQYETYYLRFIMTKPLDRIDHCSLVTVFVGACIIFMFYLRHFETCFYGNILLLCNLLISHLVPSIHMMQVVSRLFILGQIYLMF